MRYCSISRPVGRFSFTEGRPTGLSGHAWGGQRPAREGRVCLASEAREVARLGVVVGEGAGVQCLADELEAALDLELGDMPVGRAGSHGTGSAAGPTGLQGGDVSVHGVHLSLDGAHPHACALGGLGNGLGVDREDGHEKVLSFIAGCVGARVSRTVIGRPRLLLGACECGYAGVWRACPVESQGSGSDIYGSRGPAGCVTTLCSREGVIRVAEC